VIPGLAPGAWLLNKRLGMYLTLSFFFYFSLGDRHLDRGPGSPCRATLWSDSAQSERASLPCTLVSAGRRRRADLQVKPWTDAIIFEILSPQYLAKNGVFTQSTGKFCKELSWQRFLNKSAIFSPKIAENSEHNIGPWTTLTGKIVYLPTYVCVVTVHKKIHAVYVTISNS
jgi:hypothetical protein